MTEEDLSIPSNRIRFALVAMKEFEAKPNCEIDMNDWRYSDGDTCYACCGGAAWLKLAGFQPSTDSDDWVCSATDKVDMFECSLNHARNGNVEDMFELMNLDEKSGKKFNRLITDFHRNPDRFYTDMESLADDLEEAGY